MKELEEPTVIHAQNIKETLDNMIVDSTLITQQIIREDDVTLKYEKAYEDLTKFEQSNHIITKDVLDSSQSTVDKIVSEIERNKAGQTEARSRKIKAKQDTIRIKSEIKDLGVTVRETSALLIAAMKDHGESFIAREQAYIHLGMGTQSKADSKEVTYIDQERTREYDAAKEIYDHSGKNMASAEKANLDALDRYNSLTTDLNLGYTELGDASSYLEELKAEIPDLQNSLRKARKDHNEVKNDYSRSVVNALQTNGERELLVSKYLSAHKELQSIVQDDELTKKIEKSREISLKFYDMAVEQCSHRKESNRAVLEIRTRVFSDIL